MCYIKEMLINLLCGFSFLCTYINYLRYKEKKKVLSTTHELLILLLVNETELTRELNDHLSSQMASNNSKAVSCKYVIPAD